MKNLPGFATYGFVLFVAVVALSGVVYAIQGRAKEFLYYKELNKQRTAGFTEEDLILCGGPADLPCAVGYTCKITKSGKAPYGKCTKGE